jgi:hypothetical protein
MRGMIIFIDKSTMFGLLKKVAVWGGQCSSVREQDVIFKGTVSRDFRLHVFFMNKFPPKPQSISALRKNSKLPKCYFQGLGGR